MKLNKEKIEEVMQDRGLTQIELAEKMGISRITLCNRINHPCNEKLSTIQKLADALECAVRDIADGIELESEDNDKAEKLRKKIIDELIDADLPPDALQTVLKIIKKA